MAVIARIGVALRYSRHGERETNRRLPFSIVPSRLTQSITKRGQPQYEKTMSIHPRLPALISFWWGFSQGSTGKEK